MISPIILTRSSYLYVLSVSHTASRIVRISLLMNLECQKGVLSPLPLVGDYFRLQGQRGQKGDLDACGH